ncbi:MAG TPA: PAS domain S-box protein, partial [Longimicrobiaceae bacterium]|nr:PAS domain S-box protein [Longimicrobiaceae bacterium]
REGIWSGETLLLSAAGEEIPVDEVVLAHRSAHGETEFLSVIARDVREQKRAAAALRESEERFRCAVQSLDEGLIITDLDDRVLYVNERMATMIGYSGEEILGRLSVEVLQIDDEDAMEERNQRRREGITERYQLVMKRRDGQSIPVEITGTPFLSPNGEIVGTLGAITDITERKELEEQLVQSQKMEAVGRLAGGVAHDFNNLLTAIKGFTELLLLDFDENDPRRSFITEIQGASNRAAGLTRQLLAFSRKQVLQPRVLDLNGSVTEIEKMLRRLIGEDVELITRPDPALGRVKADPGQMEQVLMNLVVNARDAMPDGGRLTVSTGNATLSADDIPPHAGEVVPGRFVVLSVQDTGTGMDEQTKGRIFEPFFTTKGQGKGTGLGLATVYGIVQQSGGFIEVESELGEGTTFRIALPRVEEAAEEQNAERPASGPVSGTETVLLVEDEVAVRVLVRRVLDRAGYRILEASSGQAALDLLADTGARVDLLLTDVVMPGMSGRELADELTARTPGLPVLYMSGYTDEAIMHHGVLAEGVAFLEKPFTPDILLRKLRDVLDGAPA